MSDGMQITRRKALQVDKAEAGVKIFGTKHTMSVTEKQFTELFEKLSGGVKGAQMVHVMTETRLALLEAFKLGCTVKVPSFGIFRVIASGTEDPTAEDGGQPIELWVNLLLDKGFKTSVQTPGTITYQVTDQKQVLPTIVTVEDVASGSLNSTLTPGKLFAIEGQNLKIDPTKTEQGIYLVPASGAGETVKVSEMLRPRHVLLEGILPTGLVSGESYFLEVRACPRGTETIRVGRFNGVLVIA